MTRSITWGRIIESMMCPVSTSLALCLASLMRPRHSAGKPLLAPKPRIGPRPGALLAPKTANRGAGCRSYDLADHCVDLGAYAGGGSRRVVVEEDRAAHRDEAGRRITVPCRPHRGRDIATLRAYSGNQKRQLRGLAHVGDGGRCGRADDQAHVAVPVGALGHVRDAKEERRAIRIEVLQVLRAGVRAAAHDVHAA